MTNMNSTAIALLTLANQTATAHFDDDAPEKRVLDLNRMLVDEIARTHQTALDNPTDLLLHLAWELSNNISDLISDAH